MHRNCAHCYSTQVVTDALEGDVLAVRSGRPWTDSSPWSCLWECEGRWEARRRVYQDSDPRCRAEPRQRRQALEPGGGWPLAWGNSRLVISSARTNLLEMYEFCETHSMIRIFHSLLYKVLATSSQNVYVLFTLQKGSIHRARSSIPGAVAHWKSLYILTPLVRPIWNLKIFIPVE